MAKCGKCGHDSSHNHHEHDHDHNKRKYIFPSRAIDNTLPINIDIMSTFNKVDKPDVVNKRTTYCISFQRSEVSKDGPTLEWRYKRQVDRDADYDEVRSRISLTL